MEQREKTSSNRMQLLREEKGLNMKEAAAQLQLPYTTYRNYEQGLREPNSETLVQKIKSPQRGSTRRGKATKGRVQLPCPDYTTLRLNTQINAENTLNELAGNLLRPIKAALHCAYLQMINLRICVLSAKRKQKARPAAGTAKRAKDRLASKEGRRTASNTCDYTSFRVGLSICTLKEVFPMAKKKRRADGRMEIKRKMPDGKVRHFLGQTAKECEDKYRQALVDFNARQEEQAAGPMFEEVAAAWWEQAQPTLKPGSLRSYKACYRAALDHFSGRRMREIKPQDIS